MADTLQPRSGLAASRVSERYRLEQVAGAGAMATVWRAYDKRLDRKVAIKVMSDALAADPASVARFVREARTAAAISHRNLVQVYDYSAAGDQPYLVMEYVDGGTLAAAIAAGPLQAGAVAELARDLLSALQCVHGAGVLHRDVKPANVLRGSDGRARLTDFGIAGLEDETRLTLPGKFVGTLRYLAPEVLDSEPPSRRSDLYALGVLLREIPVDGELDPRLASVIEDLTRRE